MSRSGDYLADVMKVSDAHFAYALALLGAYEYLRAAVEGAVAHLPEGSAPARRLVDALRVTGEQEAAAAAAWETRGEVGRGE